MHRIYYSGAIMWGSDHPTKEIVLLLKNIAMYNYTPVSGYPPPPGFWNGVDLRALVEENSIFASPAKKQIFTKTSD